MLHGDALLTQLEELNEVGGLLPDTLAALVVAYETLVWPETPPTLEHPLDGFQAHERILDAQAWLTVPEEPEQAA